MVITLYTLHPIFQAETLSNYTHSEEAKIIPSLPHSLTPDIANPFLIVIVPVSATTLEVCYNRRCIFNVQNLLN